MTNQCSERPTWRKSSFSGANGDCVEVAEQKGRIAMRHSKEPEQGMIFYTKAEMDAFIRGCKAGEFDDLTFRSTSRS